MNTTQAIARQKIREAEPVGKDWLQSLDDEFDRRFPASATPLMTQDGTVIVTDTAGNSASGRTTEEALANFGKAIV